jgi:hypothetical protein
MTYLENIDQYGFMELAPRQVELDESEKQRIRKNIADGRAKLDAMNEIEKTAFTLQALENRFGWAKGGLL